MLWSFYNEVQINNSKLHPSGVSSGWHGSEEGHISVWITLEEKHINYEELEQTVKYWRKALEWSLLEA